MPCVLSFGVLLVSATGLVLLEPAAFPTLVDGLYVSAVAGAFFAICSAEAILAH